MNQIITKRASVSVDKMSQLPRKRSSFFSRLKAGGDEFKSIADKREIPFTLSTFEAGVLIAKAALHGSWTLLPWSYTKIGHVLGFIGLIVLYAVVWAAVKILVRTAHELSNETGEAQLGYGEVAQQSVLSRWSDEKAAYAIRIFVDIIVFLALFVTASLYLIQTTNFIYPLVPDLCITVWLLAMLFGLLLVILAFINHLKWVVPICLIGCICIIMGAIFSVVALYNHVQENSRDDDAVFNSPGQWPFYLGCVPFIVTWIYVILPVERDSREPLKIVESYCSPWFMILLIVLSFHCLIGFLGYDVIGPKAAPNTLSQFSFYVSFDPYAILSSILVAIGVFCTINLLILIAAQIVWVHLKDRLPEDFQIVTNILLAPLIMTLSIAIAVFAFEHAVVLAIIATICVGLISFIFPPVFNFIMKSSAEESKTARGCRYFFNILILIIGIVIIICGIPTDYRLWKDMRKLNGVFMEH